MSNSRMDWVIFWPSDRSSFTNVALKLDAVTGKEMGCEGALNVSNGTPAHPNREQDMRNSGMAFFMALLKL